MDLEPVMQAADRVLALIERLRAKDSASVMWIWVEDWESNTSRRCSARDCRSSAKLRERSKEKNLHVFIEPGRSIVANAGVLVTRVLYRKTDRREGIRDCGRGDERSDPARAVWGASRDRSGARIGGASFVGDVVGPVCETGDFLARDRELPGLLPGDLPGDFHGRGVRIRAVVELQFTAARGGSAGGWRRMACRPAARKLR